MPGAHWIERLLYIAGSLVVAIYVFQTLWPRLRHLFHTGPTAEERTADLLQHHRESRMKQHMMGVGFDGNATNLSPLTAPERAECLAKLAGGVEKLRSAVEQALAEGEAQWAAELADHLLVLNTGDTAAKHLKADALTMLAERQTNARGREFYLTQARQLRAR